jgi:hypothetical protein
LRKLGVKRLPVGADVSIAKGTVLQFAFGHMLREAQRIESTGSTKVPESFKLWNWLPEARRPRRSVAASQIALLM